MVVDTLIVERDGMYKIERYNGQNLDEYNHIAELNHEYLVEAKESKHWYMESVSFKDVFDYLAQEFNYKF